MPLAGPADSWDNEAMSAPLRPTKPETAPALYRLLAESALSRAALGSCGVPVALLEASGRSHAVTYVNSAFQAFFGYGESDSVGRPLAALVFRNDEALVQRFLAEAPKRWQLSAW